MREDQRPDCAHLRSGRIRGPWDPGGVADASSISVRSSGTPANRRSQSISTPEVAMPPARQCGPGSTPAVVQSLGCVRVWSRILMMNMVELYMSIKSTGRRTPTLNPSAQGFDGAAEHGRSDRKPGGGCASPGHLAHDPSRPRESGQRDARRDLASKFVRPVASRQVVERVAFGLRIGGPRRTAPSGAQRRMSSACTGRPCAPRCQARGAAATEGSDRSLGC